MFTSPRLDRTERTLCSQPKQIVFKEDVWQREKRDRAALAFSNLTESHDDMEIFIKECNTMMFASLKAI